MPFEFGKLLKSAVTDSLSDNCSQSDGNLVQKAGNKKSLVTYDERIYLNMCSRYIYLIVVTLIS